jgi:hypothetical protein
MSFTNTVTETVSLSDGQSAVVRKLGWKALKAAATEKQRQALGTQKEMGVAFFGELRKAIEEQGGADRLRELAAKDPFLQYDQDTLLQKGVVSWTLDRPLTPESLDDLDAETADLLARRICDLSRPKTEDERKNS